MSFRPEYVISMGQDCSTFLFSKHLGLKYQKFIFDDIAVYSDMYLKLMNREYLYSIKNNINVIYRHSVVRLSWIFDRIKHWNKKDNIRMDFIVQLGDKYDACYVNIFHVENDILYNLVYADTFEVFLFNIEEKIVPYIKDYMAKQIQMSINAMKALQNKNVLFIRTIKHKMTQKEANDIKSFRTQISQYFNNSKLVVITDNKENLKYNVYNIIYIPFDHWTYNEKYVQQFKKNAVKCGIII